MKEKTILLLLEFCCMLATVAALDCSQQENIQNLVLKCFSDQGLQLALPDASGNAMWVTETWIESTFIEHSSEICLKKGEYQNTVNCFVGIVKQCTINDRNVFLPANNFMANFVEALCHPLHRPNFDCLKKQFGEISKCSGAAGEMINGQCEVYKKHFDCHTSSLTECGCYTLRAFEMILVGMFHPPECPKEMDRQLAECDAVGNLKHSVSGAGQLCDHIAVYLVGSLALIAFELFVI